MTEWIRERKKRFLDYYIRQRKQGPGKVFLYSEWRKIQSHLLTKTLLLQMLTTIDTKE